MKFSIMQIIQYVEQVLHDKDILTLGLSRVRGYHPGNLLTG